MEGGKRAIAAKEGWWAQLRAEEAGRTWRVFTQALDIPQPKPTPLLRGMTAGLKLSLSTPGSGHDSPKRHLRNLLHLRCCVLNRDPLPKWIC